MKYLSVCSGIEAASVAWDPLGWKPMAFSEIDSFACAVLAHHYPDVPNLGDMTNYRGWPRGEIDLLVGGTPCQSFSIAGLRKGLDDPRGNLALVYLGVAERYKPRWLVWENVPGVLSSKRGRDFGSFLGALAELGYRWAYRVLDAQYVRTRRFGRAVPQRRRRVFVAGHLGDWRRAAAVLLESESLRGNPPPRREAGKDVAGTLAARINGGGGLGTDFDISGGLVPQCFGGGNTSGPVHVAACLGAKGQRIGFEVETFAIQERAASENLNAGPGGAGFRNDGAAYTLEARTIPQAVVFDCKGSQVQLDTTGSSPTLRAMGSVTGRSNGGGHLAVAFDLRGREGGAVLEGPHDTANLRAASGGSSRSYVATRWAVRRLTPTECERLQGFPDGYTAVPYRGKPATDSPRYRALGNSMAVNVMEWIGHRIAEVEAL